MPVHKLYGSSTGATAGERYVHRGDPSAFDRVLGDFTRDDAWHDLDLSDILPVEAAGRLIHIGGRAWAHTNQQRQFWFREKGNSNDVNVLHFYTQNTDFNYGWQGWVKCDADRVIQYKVNPYIDTSFDFVVRGWMAG